MEISINSFKNHHKLYQLYIAKLSVSTQCKTQSNRTSVEESEYSIISCSTRIKCRPKLKLSLFSGRCSKASLEQQCTSTHVSLAITLLPIAAWTAISNSCLGRESFRRSHMVLPTVYAFSLRQKKR